MVLNLKGKYGDVTHQCNFTHVEPEGSTNLSAGFLTRELTPGGHCRAMLLYVRWSD
jgi:hypothetical protein